MRNDPLITFGLGLAILGLVYLALFTTHLDAGVSNQRQKTVHTSSNFEADIEERALSERMIEVPLSEVGGTYTLGAMINGSGPYPFVLDSGASHLTLPINFVDELSKSGLLTENDYTGYETYTLADGRTIKARTFVLRQIVIGSFQIENVQGSVAPAGAPALLGQSVLRRLKKWKIDNERNVLILEH
jgi:clan AA aspartic protease (TIGR02281 family)